MRRVGLDLVERQFDLVGERQQRCLAATVVLAPCVTISQDCADHASGQGEDHDLSGTVGEVHPDVGGSLICHRHGGDQEHDRSDDDDADDDPGAVAAERGSHVELRTQSGDSEEERSTSTTSLVSPTATTLRGTAPSVDRRHAGIVAGGDAPAAEAFVIATFSLAGRARRHTDDADLRRGRARSRSTDPIGRRTPRWPSPPRGHDN